MSNELGDTIRDAITEANISSILVDGIVKATTSYSVKNDIESVLRPIIIAAAKEQLQDPNVKAIVDQHARNLVLKLVEPCTMWAIARIAKELSMLDPTKGA